MSGGTSELLALEVLLDLVVVKKVVVGSMVRLLWYDVSLL